MKKDLTYRVCIRNDVYELTMLDGVRSLKLGFSLQRKLTPLLASAVTGDSKTLIQSISECLEEEQFYDIMMDLINVNMLKCNNNLIDINTHFRGRVMDLYILAYEALKVNYGDFFSFISGFMKENSESEDILSLIKQINIPKSEITSHSIPSDQTTEEQNLKPQRKREKRFH